MADRIMEELDENECLRLIGSGGIGRIAYVGRFGPAVLPVNYQLRGGAIVFRTAENAALDEDLRTGIANADYKVAFEIDEIDAAAQQGWSVLIQGPAHHVTGPSWTWSTVPASSRGLRASGAFRPHCPVPDHRPPRPPGLTKISEELSPECQAGTGMPGNLPSSGLSRPRAPWQSTRRGTPPRRCRTPCSSRSR